MQYNITVREKDKKWQYIISYKIDGKWKQKSKQGFTKAKEAKRAAQERLKELEESGMLEAPREVLALTLEGAFDLAAELKKRQGLTIGTINALKVAKNKLQPFWDIEIFTLKVVNIKEIEHYLIENCGSPIDTFDKTKNIVKMAAEYHEVPCPPIHRLGKGYKPPEKKEKSVPTIKQCEDIANRCDTLYAKAFITLAYTSGLRRGEILGITWKDILKVENVYSINITRQWSRRDRYEKLKTSNSKRIVYIPRSTYDLLIELRDSMPLSIDRRIFYTYKYHSIRKPLRKALKDTGLTLHSFRHAYATNLVQSNKLDIKTVARLLGDTVDTVLKTYLNVNEDMEKSARATVAEIFN